MIISIIKYVILRKRLRTLNFYEISKKFAFYIKKKGMDVNMKKI